MAFEWESRSVVPLYNSAHRAVAFNGSVFAVLSMHWNGSEYDPMVLHTSPDAVVWTERRTFASGMIPDYMCAINGLILLADYYGRISVSSDNGATWTDDNTYYGSKNFMGASACNGTFFIHTSTNYLLSSVTGLASSWSENYCGLTSGERISVSFGGGIYVAVQNATRNTATSTNGTSWTINTNSLPLYHHAFRVVYGAGVFVFGPETWGGGSTEVFSSTDGVVWSSHTVDFYNSNGVIAWDGASFVIQNNGYTSLISTDGITWATTASPCNIGNPFLVASNPVNNVTIGYNLDWVTMYYGASPADPLLTQITDIVFGVSADVQLGGTIFGDVGMVCKPSCIYNKLNTGNVLGRIERVLTLSLSDANKTFKMNEV